MLDCCGQVCGQVLTGAAAAVELVATDTPAPDNLPIFRRRKIQKRVYYAYPSAPPRSATAPRDRLGAGMIRVLKRANSSAAGLVALPAEIKLPILKIACERSGRLVLGPFGLLLASIFAADGERAFNSAVYELSGHVYRCAEDLRATSRALWHWSTLEYRKIRALSFLKGLFCDRNMLFDCLQTSADLLPLNAEGPLSPMYSGSWRSSHIVVYTAVRAATHTTQQLVDGVIATFNFKNDVLSVLGVDECDLVPRVVNRNQVEAFPVLSRFELARLQEDRELGIYACLVAVKPHYNPIDGSTEHTDELTGRKCAIYPFWYSREYLADAHNAWD